MNLLSTLIGGFISLLGAFLGVKWTYKKEREKLEEQENKLLKSLYQSLHDEIETLWNLYQDEVGVHLESLEEGKPFLYLYPLTQDYFTFYHANSFLIGRIEDNDLRKLIITTYTLAKGLVDSYRLNNEMIQRYTQLEFLYRQTANQIIYQELKAEELGLIEYAKKLKEGHIRTKESVSNLLRMLRKKGVLSEKKE